jgi:Rad3-related DNA helicase
MAMTDRPTDWGLPTDHASWRPGQREALDWCTGSGVRLLEAPTGSGKTGLAAAAGHERRILALCRTKNLQVENYQHTYGFDVLFGKSNYPCVHPDSDPGATCTDCLFTKRGEKGRGMYKCDVSGECEYLLAKSAYLNSPRACANYAYWLSSTGARDAAIKSRDHIFLDEAHQLVDLVLEYCGVTITQAHRAKYSLPPFPIARQRATSGPSALLANGEEEIPIDRIHAWLESSYHIVALHLGSLQRSEVYNQEDPGHRRGAREAERLLLKIETMQEALGHGDDWYFRSGWDAIEWSDGKHPGLIAKPLTPRAHFPRYFPVDQASEGKLGLVLMSATIGDCEVFANQWGLGDNYGSYVVPSRYTPAQQPIYDLGAPGMGRSAKADAYDKQAELIAQAIKSVPASWPGIIHVTRIKEAPLLARRLSDNGLDGRLWVPPSGVPTNVQMEAWKKRLRYVPNSIVVSWSMWEGYDGLEEKISIVAKVPFPFLGSEYQRRRMKADPTFYRQMAAWQVGQACGRTGRGREGDYDGKGERRGLVCVADGNFGRVKKLMSRARRESVVKGLP